MAELLLNNKPNHKYKIGDVVYIAEDGHVWSAAEQNTNLFTIVTGVTLSTEEKDLLRTTDEQLNIPKSAVKLPSQLSKLVKQDNKTMVNRRKYYYDNGIKRRPI